jgi:malate dehydrogenase (oxaloacetate-decarboxylating)
VPINTPHSDHSRRSGGGLLGVRPKLAVRDGFALSVVYTPGVAEPCREIERDASLASTYTWTGNAVALVGRTPSDLPWLETVAVTLKTLAFIDATPLLVAPGRSLVDTLRRVAPTYGAVWLLAVSPDEADAVLDGLADVGLPILPPPGEDYAISDPAVYPGLLRALLDLGATTADGRLITEAEVVGGEHGLSFATAPAVTAAVISAARDLGLSDRRIEPCAVANRLINGLETGRLAPIESVPHWLDTTDRSEMALRLHGGLGGCLEVAPRVSPRDPQRLIQLFGDVGAAAAAIHESPEAAADLTCRGNLVAVVTDGSAVLGLGDIGAVSGLPVMLGKSVLFKVFGGCDAVPICVDADDPAEIVDVVEAIAPTFGGINLEDISAPRCFEIEEELQRRLDCFVFHDDQHGTAVVTLAGLINAAKLCDRGLDELTVTFNGAGAAGIAVTKLLLAAGVQDVILCDRAGPIYEGRTENMNATKDEIARITNRDRVAGALADALRGRHAFIGLSVGGLLDGEMIRTMADRPIVLAMANPVPEILPDEARSAGAAAVATGRSDFPNQINNCLGFPGIFRGALDVRAKAVNDAMKIAAAEAIAGLVTDERLRPDYFIPDAVDLRVPPAVAAAIARAAIDSGEARVPADPDEIALRTRRLLYGGPER